MAIPLLAIYGGIAAAKAGLGAYQYFQGKKRARNNNIDNQVVSAETKKNLSLAERMAKEGMPEQSFRNQQENIDRNTATGIRTLQTGRNIAGGVSNIVANANKATSNLNAMDAEARQRNNSILMRYRDVVAGEKRRGYEQEAMAAQGLMGAGIQNLAGGLDTLGAGAIGAAELDVLGGTGDVVKQTAKEARKTRKQKRLSELMAFQGVGGSPDEEVDLTAIGG